MQLIDFVMFVQGSIMVVLTGLLMKERILKFHYKDRRKRAFFIDLRISRWITLDEARVKFTFRGIEFIWDMNYEYNECCIFNSKCASPMKIKMLKKSLFGKPHEIVTEVQQAQALNPEIAKDELYYWPESTEFKHVFHNKLFHAMMLAMKGDMLMYILAAIGIAVIVGVWNYNQISNMQQQLDVMGQYLVGINNNITHSPVVRNP